MVLAAPRPTSPVASKEKEAKRIEVSSSAGTCSTRFNLHPRISPRKIELHDGTILTVRLMEKKDYPTVRAIMPQVSRCQYVFEEEAVTQLLSCPTFFPFVVVGGSDNIVGFAELHRLPHLGRGFDARLEKVLVLPDWRGKKLAQRMTTVLLDIAKNTLQCGRVDLTVEKPDAMKVYANMGFQKVDTTVERLMF